MVVGDDHDGGFGDTGAIVNPAIVSLLACCSFMLGYAANAAGGEAGVVREGPFHRPCVWWLEPESPQTVVLFTHGDVQVGPLMEYEDWLEGEFDGGFRVVGVDPIDSLHDLTILGHWNRETIFVALGSERFVSPWTGEVLVGHNCANVAYVTMDGNCDREAFLHEVGHALGLSHAGEGIMRADVTC